MADPLSIALAAISLATALKDIIELAQTLNDSFKKPGRNMQRVESLAAETLGIVKDLQKFYDGHKEILDSAPDMQDAVLRLLKEIERVHEECIPILQIHSASDGKLHTWIKRKVGPWWKRNTVEESIRSLRDGANKCRGDFMMFALLRIEAATAQVQATTAQVEASTAQTQASAIRIEATTTEIRAAVTHGLARPRVQLALNPQVMDDSFLAFLGSTPVILSHLPPHVKLAEHLVYKEAITCQVGKIRILFKMFASGGFYPVEEPDSSHLQSCNLVTHLTPSTKEEIEDLQFDVFAQIAKIRENLKGRNNGQSIQGGAWAMLDLSVWLYNLDMYHESLAMSRFAVDLYRTLSKTNEDVYGPRLAHALYLMSYTLGDTGELVQAYKAITEAVTLGRRLVAASPTFEAQMQLANLVRYSSYVARRNGDLENATRDAEEAVQTYERLIGNSTSALQMDVSIMDKRRGPTVMTLEATRVCDFARALVELHYNLSATSRKDESVSAGIKALELYSALEQKAKHTGFSRLIADICHSLASIEYRDVISIEEALSYAQNAVPQYEKVLQHTGNVPHNLPFSLARQGKILSDLGRVEEAYVVCQKLEQVVQKHIEDHQLRARSLLQLTQNLFHSKHYMEAALIGEQLVATCRVSLLNGSLYNAYIYTSLAFERSGNTLKAIQIAESAVSYWRVLAFHDSKNVKFLAASVDDLAGQLLSVAEHEQALSEGHEAMKLYSSLIQKDATHLEYYMKTLQLNMDIATQAKMEIQSLERSQEVIQYSRALVKQFPDQQISLIRLILDHANMLEKFDQLAEGGAAIEEALSWFDAHPLQDPESVKLQTYALLYSSRLLLNQGHLDNALSVYDKTIKVGQSFAHTDSEIASNILWAKALTLMTFYFIGHVPLALAKIEDCLTFAAEHGLEEEQVYTFYLENALLFYRSSGDINKAVSNMRRSIDIDRGHNRIPSSWILSDLLADTGDEEALTVANDVTQELEQLQFEFMTTQKEFYAQSQYTLSLRLFANNDLVRARDLLLEVRLFYQQHSQTRNLWFIKLAITIWALGHLECASGQHEEGIAARIELTELRQRLRLIFPRLDEFVEVGLKRERNFAAWKNLLKKINLKCGHQDEGDTIESAVISQFKNLAVSSDEPV